MKAKSRKIIAPVVLGATLLQLAACGGGGSGSGSGSGSEGEPRQFESDAEGMYVAQMTAINNGVGGAISGSLSINKDGSRLIAYMRMNGGQPNVVHQQRVYVGTSCPTAANDTNGDGYVDVNEAFAHTGKILFPLDADISGQERGSSIWPAGDMYGYYHWERATSFERFISDLREPDLNEENDFAKLGPDGSLNLDGRVVMIHGAAEMSNLPDTVGTRGRLRNFQVIPIACGLIKKVSSIPGEIEDDPSLGAAPGEGETVGGSSGADDGATVPVEGAYRPGETSGGTTGTTNDARNDPRNSGGSAGGTTGGVSDDDDDDDGGIRWPWERRPRTTTGGTGGGTTGGTTGGDTTGGTAGGTTGGTTGATYGDDEE